MEQLIKKALARAPKSENLNHLAHRKVFYGIRKDLNYLNSRIDFLLDCLMMQKEINRE